MEFNATELIEAVAAAGRRGGEVRVMLNAAGRGGVSDNAAARSALQAVGVEVADASHELSVVHEKSLVIDDQSALVMSCDWSEAGLGVQVRRLKHQRLHGNMLLAEGARALVGSVNFSPTSLHRRRELAIETDDAAVVRAMQLASTYDWSHSRPIDLSEEGLREELQRHGRAGDAEHLLGAAPEDAA
jgi:phosphatidylserine/phosphatidylglycerophosphate/cardiolipin synthase-like enzyme